MPLQNRVTPWGEIVALPERGLLTGNRISWLMSLSMLPFLGYLLFIKKYLHPRGAKRKFNQYLPLS